MMRALLVPLISTMPAQAARSSFAQDLSGGTGLKQFQAWASSNCKDCAVLIGGFLDGVNGAGFLKDSDWDGKVLTATLTEYRLYGEIADKSRLPAMWVLDQTMTFAFTTQAGGETAVQVSGLTTEPSTQGLELYESAMKYLDKGIDMTCVGDEACTRLEVQATGKYLTKEWNKIKRQEGKVSRVLRTMYGNFAIFTAVKLQGKDKWGDVLYSMITAVPTRITGFVFKDGQVYLPNEFVADERYEKYHLQEKTYSHGKNLIMNTNGAQRDIALKFARSSFNFAVAVAHGKSQQDHKAYEETGLHAGRVDAIANVLSWCAGTRAGESPACSGGKPGRVGWSPTRRD